MPCMGSSNACPLGAGSDHWHTKPVQEETLLFPLQFDSSTGHDQLSELVQGFQARSKDQEILEEGGGAGPSLLPRRDHE